MTVEMEAQKYTKVHQVPPLLVSRNVNTAAIYDHHAGNGKATSCRKPHNDHLCVRMTVWHRDTERTGGIGQCDLMPMDALCVAKVLGMSDVEANAETIKAE